MTRGALPSLDSLQQAAEAAWLWDIARVRIVWANEAGIRFFGGELLFDLLDRRFDRGEPGVARLIALADELVRPGQASEEVLSFPSSPFGEPIACDCYAHRLSDGRSGLLVIAKPVAPAEDVPPADLASAVIDALPQAVLTLDRDGRTLHANAPASDLLSDARRRGLSELFAHERNAARFIERVIQAGIVGEYRRIETRYGARDVRIEARRIGPRGGAEQSANARILLLIEDVAERRALERSLQENAARLADFVAAAADFTFELDQNLAWQAIGPDFTEATGVPAEEIVGETWQAVAQRFDFDRDGLIAQAMAERKSWRATVEWRKAHDVLATTTLSAVAVDGDDRRHTAYRGIGALVSGASRPAPSPAPQSAAAAGQASSESAASAEQTRPEATAVSDGGPAAKPADKPVVALYHAEAGTEAIAPAPQDDAKPSRSAMPVANTGIAAPADHIPVTDGGHAIASTDHTPAVDPTPQRESKSSTQRRLTPEEAEAFLRLAQRIERDLASVTASEPDLPKSVRETAPALAEVATAELAVVQPEPAVIEPEAEPVPAPAPSSGHPKPESLAVTVARELLAGIEMPSLIHRDGQVLAANQGAAEALGYDNPEALEVVGLDALLPDWRSRGEEACFSTPEGHIASNSITARSLDWPGGPVRQLIFTPRGKPLPGKDAAAVPDVWAPSDSTLKAIIETATDGIIMLERNGTIRSINAGAQAIFGIDAREALGRPLSDFLTAESAKTFKDYLAALVDGTLTTIFNDGREVTGIERQGGEIPLFLTMSPVEDGDRFCAVLRDITHWKKAEADLRAAKEEAERTSAQKSEFLANISHELRTPLNAILGFSEVMKAERFGAIRNDKYLGYIGDIHASGEHLLSLINDLLDLSKVEAGKLELNFTAVNLVDVVDQAVHIMQDQAREGRVLMRTSIPADLPPVVADQRSIRQIVLNLLSNAVKFTEPGGQVIISLLTTPQGEVKLRVKDTGIGMTEDELQEALKPFRRVETKRRRAGGTGLGLPLTKALTEANRAGFAISSRPESGTMVEITFPTTRVLAE
ncbi:PAS domain-containing sensor histidine kinase [Rhodoligotrophos ferricapiens]|uniref:PAS domain-containing sensor histidine kinase n=1 Tax=Rhodoligotrophos ferricapiens TaxID=3069264 RepID=UPI00315CF921